MGTRRLSHLPGEPNRQGGYGAERGDMAGRGSKVVLQGARGPGGLGSTMSYPCDFGQGPWPLCVSVPTL